MDMTDQFNTALSPEEEKRFQALYRDRLGDLYDYDLRGFFRERGAPGEGHLTDRYKKPNHPTFSNESLYHSPESGIEGGEWSGDERSGFVFRPGRTNLEYYSPPMLENYFSHNEPGVRLNLQGEY